METGIFTTGEPEKTPFAKMFRDKQAFKELVGNLATASRAERYLDACGEQAKRVSADLDKRTRPKPKNEKIEAARRKHAGDVVREVQRLIRQARKSLAALADNSDFQVGFMLGVQLGELSKVLEVMPHEPMAEIGHGRFENNDLNNKQRSADAKKSHAKWQAAVDAEIKQQDRLRAKRNYLAAIRAARSKVKLPNGNSPSVEAMRKAVPNTWTPRRAKKKQ